jgi:hypothetical protein
MTTFNEMARRFDKFDGQTLIDYFPLHLPAQLLTIDVVGMDRRPMPALTEFCLKAINSGLSEAAQITGFLGIEFAYGSQLLKDLVNAEFIGIDPFGKYVLLRKAKEILQLGRDERPTDRRLQVLWDPMQERLLDRTLVYTRNRADRAGIIPPIPNAFLRPVPNHLDLTAMNRIRGGANGVGDHERPSFEILRVTAIQKSYGRYRNTLGLVYKDGDGQLAFRLAVDGVIDNDLTEAAARAGLHELVGIKGNIANKPGVQAVKKRQRELVCGDEEKTNVAKLVQRRSVLMLNLDAINARLAEEPEPTDSLINKRNSYEEELTRVAKDLDNLPVVPVRCHEIEFYLLEALTKAKTTLLITTTNPCSAKVDGEILQSFRACLARGVTIRILISDRLGDNNITLAALDRINSSKRLSVEFLQNTERSVFEITWDSSNILVSNEPPLGDRRLPVTPREFSGFYVTDGTAVKRYSDQYLAFQDSDFLKRLRPTIDAKKDKRSSRKQ